MKKLLVVLMSMAVVALGANLVLAGEWHAGTTNICTDCHTMHFSQTHNWDGSTPVGTAPAMGGNWLSASGPNQFLLKAPANQLCKACHDGQTFAPDVVAANTNSGNLIQGRGAGALNEAADIEGYSSWMGHTLDSILAPPGFNPTAAGVPATQQYVAANGLECTSCHLQHGSATVYRNLGPRTAAFQPTYAIATTPDSTKDVWINNDNTFTRGSGNPVTFNANLYDSSIVSYNVTNPTAPAGSTSTTSNRFDTFCSACHGDFHGGPGDANIGASIAAPEGFLRHPTSKVLLGAGGGHSSVTRYAANAAKVKVYANDRVGYTDATPGCVSCHKAHGNQNAFGLVYLNRTATVVNEEGGWGANEAHTPQQGYRNLCGNCHGQGN